MTARPTIHVLEHIHPDARALLAQQAEVLAEDAPFPSACDAVIVRACRITAEDMAACPNLKIIGKHGAGLDAIDVDAATQRGIAVLSTPGANAESVADLAVGFALALLRNIHTVTLAAKAGVRLSADQTEGYELSELRIGIFGIGATGRATARRLVNGFAAEVQAFDPGISEDSWPRGIARVPTLPDLLQSSQLLFLHAPLLPSTRRGIVDEAALAEALASGQIAGAASDVFEQEPPSADNPLLASPGFLATPHVGGATSGALRRVGLSIVHQVLDQLSSSEIPARPTQLNTVEEI